MTSPAASNVNTVFRAARRADWRVIAQCHLIALAISIPVFAIICASNRDPPFFVLPHYFYWTVVGGLWSIVWPLSYPGVLGMVVFPIWIYRSLCYYRHGGTISLLAAGLRGAWAFRPWYVRAPIALALGCLPTRRLVARHGLPERFHTIVPPLEGPSPQLTRLLVALAISFHHLPFNSAVQTAFCVRPPWTLVLPNWFGPCQVSFGYPKGTSFFQCPERR